MPLEIRLLETTQVDAWNAYVYQHDMGTPFHLNNWADAVSQAFGHKTYSLVAWSGNTIKGILPLTHVKSVLFGNVLSSVGFAAYGGILCDDIENVLPALLKAASDLAKEHNADYVELKWKDDIDCNLPSNDLYVTFIKELSTDHEENMKSIPRKQRRMVRKGIKSGLKALIGREYFESFYDIFAQNVRRLGTPVYGKNWFNALLDAFGKDAELMVVEYEGKIISGVLSLFYKDTVLPYYAASLTEYRKYAPNDFQYWELMQRAVDRGCRYFDYGRSKKGTGQFNYKRHWGFEPSQLHYRYILNRVSEVPAVNPLNPKYKRKIETWKKLPLWVTNIIGPHIVKYIP